MALNRLLRFLSTLSLRRATRVKFQLDFINQISIHALLAESDLSGALCGLIFKNFYPRSPCGERPTTIITICIVPRFLSTLSLRRATLDELCRMMGIKHFYPRSPCGERQSASYNAYLEESISIHALLAESDSVVSSTGTTGKSFLSTLSLRRATIISPHSAPDNGNFYPRSPCGERQYLSSDFWRG